MAENMYKKYTEAKTREWTVGENVPGGSLVINAASGEVGVTIAASGGSSVTETANLPGSLTSITRTVGGVGYKADAAVVARDGSWLFPVAGVTAGETVAGAGTDQGTPVYRTPAGVLTLAADDGEEPAVDNTPVGIIDDCYIVDGVAAIEIGVGA